MHSSEQPKPGQPKPEKGLIPPAGEGAVQLSGQETAHPSAPSREQAILQTLREKYEKTLSTFSNKENKEGVSTRKEKESAIEKAYGEISSRLASAGMELSDKEQAILRLKLARHFQSHDSTDQSTLVDALRESPKFLSKEKGSLHRLFEIHEQKTLQRIAEMRKRKASRKEGEGSNPFEALLTTESGKYFLARLLNMPHLEEESEYMKHCVGTSDSYINQMKRGETEILSLRTMPKIDPLTGERGEDAPVMTIEYSLKTGVIEQMKKADDEYLNPEDPFYEDAIDALRRLKTTKTDAGKPRNIRRIASSELENIPDPKPGHVLTDKGELSWKEFNPAEDALILKTGHVDLNPNTPKDNIVKMLAVFAGADIAPERIARSLSELKELGDNATAYVGKLEPGIFDHLPETVEHIYASFPEGRIERLKVELGGKTRAEYEAELEKEGHKISKWARDIIHKMPVSKEKRETKFVRLKVRDLFGDEKTHEYEDIKNRAIELGLKLAPAESGPALRLSMKDQPMYDWVCIGMEAIATSDGSPPGVFNVKRNESGSLLYAHRGRPDYGWYPHAPFAFSLRSDTGA